MCFQLSNLFLQSRLISWVTDLYIQLPKGELHLVIFGCLCVTVTQHLHIWNCHLPSCTCLAFSVPRLSRWHPSCSQNSVTYKSSSLHPITAKLCWSHPLNISQICSLSSDPAINIPHLFLTPGPESPKAFLRFILHRCPLTLKLEQLPNNIHLQVSRTAFRMKYKLLSLM